MCKKCGVSEPMFDKDHDHYRCKFFKKGECALTDTGAIEERYRSNCRSSYYVYSNSYSPSTVEHHFHDCPNFKLF